MTTILAAQRNRTNPQQVIFCRKSRTIWPGYRRETIVHVHPAKLAQRRRDYKRANHLEAAEACEKANIVAEAERLYPDLLEPIYRATEEYNAARLKNTTIFSVSSLPDVSASKKSGSKLGNKKPGKGLNFTRL